MTMITVPSVKMLRTADEDFSPMRNEIQRLVSMMILTGFSCIVEFLPYKFALAVNILLGNLVGIEHREQFVNFGLKHASLLRLGHIGGIFLPEHPAHSPEHLLEPPHLTAGYLYGHCRHTFVLSV